MASIPTVWQIMEAVAAQVKNATNIRSKPESPGKVDVAGGGGWLIVGVPPIDQYRAAFARGSGGIVYITDWPLYVVTSAQVDRIGQKLLAEYASWNGDKSIPLALEADRTLGLAGVTDCVVSSFKPGGLEDVGLINYFGGTFLLTVEVSGLED